MSRKSVWGFVFALSLAACGRFDVSGQIVRSGEATAPLQASQPVAGQTTTLLTPTKPLPTPTKVPVVFNPLSPTRLPQGITCLVEQEDQASQTKQTLFYNNNVDRFLLITQRLVVSFGSAPTGDPVTIGAAEGKLQSGLSGSAKVAGQEITYSNAIQVVWDTDFGTRVIVLSNLAQDLMIDFATALGVDHGKFVPMPELQWADFGNEQGAIVGGMVAWENRYFSHTSQFVILTQQPDLAGGALNGEAFKINGQDGVISRNQSGDALDPDQLPFEGLHPTYIGGGGGGSTLPEPKSIPYTNGVKIEWVQEGIRLVLRSNLPEDQVIAFAGSLSHEPPRLLWIGIGDMPACPGAR